MKTLELGNIRKLNAAQIAEGHKAESLNEWSRFSIKNKTPHAGILLDNGPDSLKYADALMDNLVGIRFTRIHLPKDATTSEVEGHINAFSSDPDIDATILMVPLPLNAEPDRRYLNSRIPGIMDADGVNLALRETDLTPIHEQPTPAAVMDLLEGYREQGLDYTDPDVCSGAIVGLGQVGEELYEMIMDQPQNKKLPDLIGLDKGFDPKRLEDRNLIISATGVEGVIQRISPENLWLSISVGRNEFAKGIRGRVAHHTSSDVGILARERLGRNIRRAAMRDRVFNGLAIFGLGVE